MDNAPFAALGCQSLCRRRLLTPHRSAGDRDRSTSPPFLSQGCARVSVVYRGVNLSNAGDLKGVCRCANWPLSGSSLWELGSLQARHPLWHPPGAMAGRNISTPPPPSASPIRRGAIVPAPNLTTVRHRAGAGGEIGGGDRVASAGDGAGAGSPPFGQQPRGPATTSAVIAQGIGAIRPPASALATRSLRPH